MHYVSRCLWIFILQHKQKQKLELKGSTKKEEIKQQMTDYMLNKFKEMSQKSGQYNEYNEITNLPPIENPVEFIQKIFVISIYNIQ